MEYKDFVTGIKRGLQIACTGFILLLIFYVALNSIRKASVFDNDNYFMFEVARQILADGFPTEDPLSMHEGLSYMTTQWLFAVIIYLLKNTFGNTSCMWFVISIFVIFSIVTFKIHTLLSGNKKTAFLTAVFSIALVSLIFLKIRPFVVSTCLSAIEILMIEEYIRKRDKRIWIGIFLNSVLFINFHNTIWIFLVPIHLCYLVDALFMKMRHKELLPVKDMLLIMLISFLGGLVNPYGFEYITYIFRAMESMEPFYGYITELQISKFSNSKPLYLTFALMIILIIKEHRKIEIRYLLLFLGTAFMAVACRRNQMLFFAFGLLLLPSLLRGRNINIYDTTLIKYGFVLFTPMFLALILSTTRVPEYEKNQSEQYEAINWMAENIEDKSGKVFASLNSGSYLEYKGFHPYIDPRVEIFGIACNKKEDIAKEYMTAYHEKFKNFDKLIEKYDFDYYLISNVFREQYIADYLDQYPDTYKMIYSDITGKVYQRIREEEKEEEKKITWENVDYESVPIINDGKPDNISSIITEELSVIYIGRDTCKDCLRIEPEVRKMMEEKGIPYYRLNIIPEDGEAEEGYWIDRSIVVGLGIKEVPAFLVLHNKKAQGLLEGDAAIKNLQTL